MVHKGTYVRQMLGSPPTFFDVSQGTLFVHIRAIQVENGHSGDTNAGGPHILFSGFKPEHERSSPLAGLAWS